MTSKTDDVREAHERLDDLIRSGGYPSNHDAGMITLRSSDLRAILALISPAPVALEAGEAMIEAFRDWYALHFGRPIMKGKARKIVSRIIASHPSPKPAAQDDRLRKAVEAITKAKDLEVSLIHDGYGSGPGGGNYVYAVVVRTDELFPLLDQALAALNPEAAK